LSERELIVLIFTSVLKQFQFVFSLFTNSMQETPICHFSYDVTIDISICNTAT